MTVIRALKDKNFWIKAFFASVLLLLIFLAHSRWEGTKYFPLREFLPRYALEHYPPKVLMYSAMTPEYLIQTASFWNKEVGIDGFIITTLPSNWYHTAAQLQKRFAITKKANDESRKNGIKHNFLRIGLEHKVLPHYYDEKAWQQIYQNIKFCAAFAKQAGFAGIALDTESYQKRLWNSVYHVNKNVSKKDLKKKVYQRGRDMMQLIISQFPEAEIFVFPVGHLFAYTKKKPNKYELWIDFFNGLASVENTKGITVGCERTYKVTEKNTLLNYYYDEINGPIMEGHMKNPVFWQEKCSIALGAWPLGREEYYDKRPNYSLEKFERQFHAMLMTCPKYVWIYAHGSSWWQEKSRSQYKLHREAWFPTVKNIKEYYAVVKQSKDPALKKYYYARMHNRLPSLLEVILGNLGL